jgi:hypothetical protein
MTMENFFILLIPPYFRDRLQLSYNNLVTREQQIGRMLFIITHLVIFHVSMEIFPPPFYAFSRFG